MKRRIMVFLFSLITGLHCLSQERHSIIGLDLTSFLRGSAATSIGYGFSPHWSVEGEVSFTYKRVVQTKSPVQEEHKSEFAGTSLPTAPVLQSSRIMLSYWTRELMRGPFVSLGLQSGSGTDIISEVGYMISLWKGMCLSIGIRIPVIRSILEEKSGAQNLRIGIHYKFQHI